MELVVETIGVSVAVAGPLVVEAIHACETGVDAIALDNLEGTVSLYSIQVELPAPMARNG